MRVSTPGTSAVAWAIAGPRPAGCRLLLAAWLLLAAAGCAAAERAAVVAIDWPFAETLIALGVQPAGVADAAAYREWVGEPALPPDTVDVGRRAAPHRATLRALAPEAILVTPYRRSPGLERIAPVRERSLHVSGEDALETATGLARELADEYGRESAFERLRARLDEAIARLRRTGEALDAPVYIAQFMDAGHLRVFGGDGLYGAVLARAGIDNAWQGETNHWGFALVPVGQLTAEASRLMIVEPVPAAAETMMAESRVWQSLPAVASGGLRRLRPVWAFGGLYAAIRFAEALERAVAPGE